MLRNYRYAAKLYQLDDASMATNFAVALKEPAKDFFLSTVKDGMSFDDISTFMLAEYNSNSRQIQVRRMLGDVSWRQFTTDLHAALTLRREREPAPADATFYSGPDIEEAAQIFMTRYGRDPRATRKFNPRNQRPAYNSQRDAHRDREPLSFEEARKRGLCKRCHQDWTPGHRCDGKGIRDHVKSRMRRGDHITHVVAELVQALESHPDEDPHNGEEATSTHLIDQDIDEFEAALGEEPNDDAKDSAFATHLLSSAFSASVVDSPSVHKKKALNRVFSASRTYQLPKLRSSPNRFRFANETFRSIGSTTLYLDTPAGVGTVAVEIDVVAADIPPLLGLDVIDRESLTPDVAFNVLAKRRRKTTADGTPIYIEEWSIPMWRAASRHSYVALSISHPTYFTRTQLQKLHRQFFHPSAEKLYNLLRRTRPENTTPATRKMLEDITARCDPCQRIRRGPTRFRVSLGVLHMVDDETKFSAAAILHRTNAGYIWDTFLKCWAAVYTGLPNRILVDQGTQLGKSQEFINIVGLHNVEFEGTGIEAHSSLGIGERYHQPLRNTYRKLQRWSRRNRPVAPSLR